MDAYEMMTLTAKFNQNLQWSFAIFAVTLTAIILI